MLVLVNHVREELIRTGESPKWRQNIDHTFSNKKLSSLTVKSIL